MPTAMDVAQEFEDDETVVDSTTEEVEETTKQDDTAIEEKEVETQDEESGKTADNPDDEGYYADEEAEVTTPDTPELPPAPSNFTPEQKYIVDNLPLINVRVIQADDSVKTLQVRSAADLPRDMKGIATPYEDKQFDLAIAAQETTARDLQNYYRQHQTQLQTQEFEEKENQAIRDDIAELQRDGEIPRFKAQPGTRAFDKDPAAQQVDEVIQFMNDRNAKYLERTNKGGAYRHIGFAEAFELMNAGGKNKVDTTDSSARKEAARKLVSKQGGSSDKKLKAPVSGRTIREVAAEFDGWEA